MGGVSQKMLAQTLKALEADGFVHRHAYKAVPPHVEHGLKPLGRQVGKRVEVLTDRIEAIPVIMDARRAHSVRGAGHDKSRRKQGRAD